MSIFRSGRRPLDLRDTGDGLLQPEGPGGIINEHDVTKTGANPTKRPRFNDTSPRLSPGAESGGALPTPPNPFGSGGLISGSGTGSGAGTGAGTGTGTGSGTGSGPGDPIVRAGSIRGIFQRTLDGAASGSGNGSGGSSGSSSTGSSSGSSTGTSKKRPIHSPGGPSDSDSSDSEGSDDKSSSGSENDSVDGQTPFANFRDEQKQLHIISRNPAGVALLPETWQGHFNGIPIPQGLFYKKTNYGIRWPRIYERTDGQDYHGSKTLINIIKVQSRIRDIRNEYLEEKDDESKDHIEKANDAQKFRARYVKTLKSTLEKAVKWAWKDGGLSQFDDLIPPTVTIFDVGRITRQADAVEKIRDTMEQLAQDWRDHLIPVQTQRRAEETKKNPKAKAETIELLVPKAPVIWGFAIMEHNVLITHLDASRQDAVPFFEMNLNMETDNQRQWYAIMILVVICFARDKLMLLANQMNLEPPKHDSSSSDLDA
ncbi:hypothetical protein SCUP515_11526 [Seiridium cupressi]